MTPAEWSAILIALITAGLLKYTVDFLKWLRTRHEAKLPEAQRATTIATVDQSLAVVARARDELEADNTRLRLEIAEKDARHDAEMAATDARHEAERARWEIRDASRRAEIEVLETKLRALLTEVEKLKDRHLYDEMEARRRMPPRTNPGGLAAQG